MIRDQRHMLGPIELNSIQQIESFWQRYAQSSMFPGFRGRPGNDFAESKVVIQAYVSDSRWVADCVTANCGGGVAVWKENPRGCCLDCGTIYTISFPDDVDEAEKVLLSRPEVNRNWFPHLGETVNQLKAENIANGV